MDFERVPGEGAAASELWFDQGAYCHPLHEFQEPAMRKGALPAGVLQGPGLC